VLLSYNRSSLIDYVTLRGKYDGESAAFGAKRVRTDTKLIGTLRGMSYLYITTLSHQQSSLCPFIRNDILINIDWQIPPDSFPISTLTRHRSAETRPKTIDLMLIGTPRFSFAEI
jgi:hypothetical protein